MSAEKASDEVIDAIAYIEMQRQDMEKQSSPAAACNVAIRKLQELLSREQEAAQADGSRHPGNIEALENEIRRVKQMLSGGGRNPKSRNQRPGNPHAQRRDKGHRHPRNRGRGSMGRPGGR